MDKKIKKRHPAISFRLTEHDRLMLKGIKDYYNLGSDTGAMRYAINLAFQQAYNQTREEGKSDPIKTALDMYRNNK